MITMRRNDTATLNPVTYEVHLKALKSVWDEMGLTK